MKYIKIKFNQELFNTIISNDNSRYLLKIEDEEGEEHVLSYIGYNKSTNQYVFYDNKMQYYLSYDSYHVAKNIKIYKPVLEVGMHIKSSNTKNIVTITSENIEIYSKLDNWIPVFETTLKDLKYLDVQNYDIIHTTHGIVFMFINNILISETNTIDVEKPFTKYSNCIIDSIYRPTSRINVLPWKYQKDNDYLNTSCKQIYKL